MYHQYVNESKILSFDHFANHIYEKIKYYILSLRVITMAFTAIKHSIVNPHTLDALS